MIPKDVMQMLLEDGDGLEDCYDHDKWDEPPTPLRLRELEESEAARRRLLDEGFALPRDPLGLAAPGVVSQEDDAAAGTPWGKPAAPEGRTAMDVTDPKEIRQIAAVYKGKGRGPSFMEIEEMFGLRRAKGMTAWRIVRKAKKVG